MGFGRDLGIFGQDLEIFLGILSQTFLENLNLNERNLNLLEGFPVEEAQVETDPIATENAQVVQVEIDPIVTEENPEVAEENLVVIEEDEDFAQKEEINFWVDTLKDFNDSTVFNSNVQEFK